MNLKVLAMIFWMLSTASLTHAQDQKSKDKLFWMFLTTGKSTVAYERSQIEEMQKKHRANFRRLADAGTLLVAGPMSDPKKILRGIVILKMKDTSKLKEMFKPDPYVEKGLMTIDVSPMEVLHGKVSLKGIDDGFDELRLVALGKSGKATTVSAAIEQEQADYLKKEYDAKRLRCACAISKSDKWHQILIFSKSDDEKLKKSIAQSPLVKSGLAKPQIIPLYVGKDSITR